MALKARVKKLEDVQEEYRSLYKADGDAFVIDVEKISGWELVDTDGLLSALQKERQAVKDQKETLLKFKGIDDPEIAKDAMVKVKEMQNWTPEDKVQAKIDENKRQLITVHKTELDESKNVVIKREKQLRDALVTNEVIRALEEENAYVEFMTPHVLNRVDMTLQEDNFVPVVFDENRLEKLKSDGTKYTILELVKEMKSQDKFSPGFKGVGSSGGGTDNDTQKGGKKHTGDRIVLSREEASDTAHYQRVKAEADKKGIPIEVDY